MTTETFDNFVLNTVGDLLNEDEASSLGLTNTAHGWIGDASPNLDMGDLFNVHRKDILSKLNQYVSSVSARTYINPTTAVARMRDKLNIVGLGIPVMPVKEGVERLPIRQFGGVFNPYTGQYDDLIAEKLGYGLELALRVSRFGSSYSVDARIVTTNDANPFDIAPTASGEVVPESIEESVNTITEVTAEELKYAKNLGERLGVDWDEISLKEFAMGLAVEREHDDVTNGNMTKVAKIAVAHIKEVSDYYSKLKSVEK